MRFSLKLIACVILAAAVVSIVALTLSFPPGDKQLRNPEPTPSPTPSIVSSHSPFPSVTPVAPTIAQTPMPIAASTPIPNSTQATPPDPTQTPFSSPSPVENGSVSLSPMFNVDLVYVYVGRTNSTGAGHDHFGMNLTMYPTNYYPVYVLFNVTYLGNPQNETFDAKFEGYIAKFSADTGTTASYVGYYGTNFNPSYSNLPNPFPLSSSSQSVSFRFNMTINESSLGLRISDGGSYSSSGGSFGLWSNGTPTAITVTVQRAGWVTASGDSISSIENPSSAIELQQVQLEKFGDGFLYNKLVPQKQLMSINPFNPPV